MKEALLCGLALAYPFLQLILNKQAHAFVSFVQLLC